VTSGVEAGSFHAYMTPMPAPPITELNDRARDVFRVVVDSYLNTGTPIGSRTIAHLSGLNLSPASIRNVMQDLEELGLLAAPHTSAGRMPTETGLRLFVDGMMQALEPSAEERAAIEARVSQAGPVEEALAATRVTLSPSDLARLEQAVPPGAASGGRYDAHSTAVLDSENS